MIPKAIEDAFHGYVECALWSSNDETDPDGSSGEPLDANYDIDDLSPEAGWSMMQDLTGFVMGSYEDVLEYLNAREITDGGIPWAYLGHDFWLTRNHHGAGFWDRGLGELGTRLTEAAHSYGSSDPYVGGDGKLYVS